MIKNTRETIRKGTEMKNILPYMKEYIIKKKNVKYFAFLESFLIGKEVDLVSLKDEVNEFKLHDIIVQSYYYLQIQAYEFIKEN